MTRKKNAEQLTILGYGDDPIILLENVEDLQILLANLIDNQKR